MAVLIHGLTECALCGQVIHEGEAAHSFPPIFVNQRSAAYVLNDAAVHEHCLDEEPFHDSALRKLRSVDERQGRKKICCVCQCAIDDPSDYFATGPLADKSDDPIAAADWIEAHVTCLPKCTRRQELVELLESVSRSAEWEGMS